MKMRGVTVVLHMLSKHIVLKFMVRPTLNGDNAI